MELSERRFEIANVAQRIAHRQEIEACIRKRDRFGRAFDQMHRCGQCGARALEHAGAGVDSDQ